ncbi:hypothetical protein M5K25_005820 [Dendrobium thyrsiflorum]|uniref:Calcium uniporter protein C-terminal domain-containing protein n=1 Tax=Dendrobium thyrsiflorum TaxID=117978 RepID=A0ABD0VIS7_DENTH
MALRKTLSSRFLHKATFAAQHSRTAPILPRPDRPELSMALSVHRRISQSAATFDGLPSVPHIPFPIGDDLMKRIRSSLFPEQIHPITTSSPPRSEIKNEEDGEIAANKIKISVQGARKLLHYSRIEKAKAKLRAIPNIFISYSEFTQICREISGGSDEVASGLDNSGAVVIIGDVVLLRPEQLAQAIESVIDPQPITDTRRSELKQMEAEKAIIDGKAGTQVRRELWAGLGLAFLQTAAFMRLTFWELSWDVMEPVCFFTTSIYFIMGWAFFLRTSKEPSFEGFFAGRFAAKQRRLMRAHNFDLSRFNELRKAFLVGSQECNNGCCDCQRRADSDLLGAAR